MMGPGRPDTTRFNGHILPAVRSSYEVGRMLGLTGARIRQIEQQALRKIWHAFRDERIEFTEENAGPERTGAT